eukprot:Rhum_TRINITY_DN14226_c13_g9::Rhum_TRINITY_DN14226_c13_g9_i1::g.75932::m.75932
MHSTVGCSGAEGTERGGRSIAAAVLCSSSTLLLVHLPLCLFQQTTHTRRHATAACFFFFFFFFLVVFLLFLFCFFFVGAVFSPLVTSCTTHGTPTVLLPDPNLGFVHCIQGCVRRSGADHPFGSACRTLPRAVLSPVCRAEPGQVSGTTQIQKEG